MPERKQGEDVCLAQVLTFDCTTKEILVIDQCVWKWWWWPREVARKSYTVLEKTHAMKQPQRLLDSFHPMFAWNFRTVHLSLVHTWGDCRDLWQWQNLDTRCKFPKKFWTSRRGQRSSFTILPQGMIDWRMPINSRTMHFLVAQKRWLSILNP